MLRQPVLKLRGLRAVFGFILIAALPSNGGVQTARGITRLGEAPTDAFTFLKQVGQRYANAAHYHIEAVTEEQMDADFSKNWSKSVTTAVLAPGNKYRFEAHTNWEWWVLVSDGKMEWLYSPSAQEYKQQTSPVGGASRFESSGLHSFLGLTKAQDTIKGLAELPSSVRTASYLADETLTLNGKEVSCYVIDAQGKYVPGWSPDTTSRLTIWVDKENYAIRKLRERMEGPLIVSKPQEHYVSDKTTLYSIVELDAAAVPDGFFAFTPPSTAELVKEFENPRRTRTEALIVGKPAPDVGLNSLDLDGKTVSLKSFQGKPVLLNFWATWLAQYLRQREDRSQGASPPEETRKGRRKKKRANKPQFDLREALFRMTGTDLTRIDSIDVMTATTIISEAGWDMSKWKTEDHFVSWLRLCPDNRICHLGPPARETS